jgi:peptidoglycan/xylan/chitin deacetylase (PgdA/CDA1 family)
MNRQRGILIISLDFELYWGMLDKKSLADYRENLLGVRKAVPYLLDLFQEFAIHATWATVGFLFCETHDELLNSLPVNKPIYKNSSLSPYTYIYTIGENEEEDPFHYAPSLIRMIASHAGQEIGSHTFSHYYCLADGQDIATFEADLRAAIKVAKKFNVTFKSIVFPRNQVNGEEYISICKKLGIIAYRGNKPTWIHKKRIGGDSIVKKMLARLDGYIPISGRDCFSINDDNANKNVPFNIQGSRFLRPYSKSFSFLQPLKLRRVLSDLSYAAKNGHIYHLFWHPENFGVNLEENISFLRKILDHYVHLRNTYRMENLSMGELSDRLQIKKE